MKVTKSQLLHKVSFQLLDSRKRTKKKIKTELGLKRKKKDKL